MIDRRPAGCDVLSVAAIDPSIAAQLAEDLGPEDFRRILLTFEQDLTRLAGQLEAAANAGQAEAYRAAAHGLAGAAGAVGALALEATARLAMARSPGPPPAILVPRLRQEAAEAVAALAALGARPPHR